MEKDHSESEIHKLKNNMGFKSKNDDWNSNKILQDLTLSSHKLKSEYELWLDKYKPNEYGDLLTEEKMTRDILSWLKSWDEIVFGKKFESRRAMINKEKNINEFTGGNNFTQNYFKKEIEYTQSKYKIILISGPPGMGKTTLARVLANHCKYEPIVINASDERTSDKLLLRIYDATQLDKIKFNKILKEKEKPTCLILDEIDGAMDGPDGKNAIKSIIDFIKNGKVNKTIINKAKKNILSQNDIGGGPSITNRNTTANQDSDDEEKIKKSADKDDSDDENDKAKINKNFVKRPIICICNDLYAKVLTILRKEALVFNIRADANKLEKRLKEICIKEKLNLDGSTIKNLCRQTNYDIRACINTLQFLSYNQSNMGLLKTLSYDKLFMLGCKDITAGLFEVWNKIFSFTPGESDFRSTLKIYNSYGEFERINDGIFVNYISNPITSNELQNRCKLLDFLSYDDILTTKIHTTHNYELCKFQCLPGAYAKNKYSSNDKMKNLKFPSMLIEHKKNKKNNFRILSSIKETFDEENPYSRLSKKSLVCDVLPFIFQLIQPQIREINTELMNKNELKQLRIAVNIMCQFGIKFNETKDSEEDDDSTKIYEPDLQQLLNFYGNNEEGNQANNSNFNNKNYMNKYNKNKTAQYNNENVGQINNTRITLKQKMLVKTEYEKLKSYKDNTKESKTKNAFGIINVTEELREKMNNVNINKNATKNFNANMTFGRKRNFNQFSDPEYKFVYRFNEGVTNTVRRNLNINYFFK